MKILSVALEQVFFRDQEGCYASLSTFDNTFWSRYLDVFDQVRVVARVQEVEQLPEGAVTLSDPRIRLVEIPFYHGPTQYLRRLRQVRRALAQAARADGDWMLRLPGVLGLDIASRLNSTGRRFSVELVGDPHEIFQPGVTGSALTRPLLRKWFVSRTRKACAQAKAVAYVSRHVLPQRYPVKAGVPVEHYSSINLPADRFAAEARSYATSPCPVRLLTVGSLAYSVKGVDVLLRACSKLQRGGLDFKLDIIGDGITRNELQQLAEALGVAENVVFWGHRPHDEIFTRMDECDLFILPSRSEGLPRVVVEAMARGTPCISTWAGGIPELLEPEWLTEPGDSDALASIIAKVIAEPKTLSAMSARNLIHARDYEATVLAARRTRFYRAVRATAEQG
ncbi:glycosyltransferase [Rhizobium rhizoryzae]|uniref:glycosyltransferase n=1 Tax=Rhizobium rhizoryzae TaxID=451876 RepID=UPI0028B15359|nr:glycosyltransferase [Rhizobium rhizoryzae]